MAIFAMISIVAVFSVGSFLNKSPDIMPKTSVYIKQLGSVALGFAALFVCYAIPYKWYRFLAPYLFGISVVMLLLLFVPGLTDERNGAERGLVLFGHTIQVFEFVKVGLILFLSWAMEKYAAEITTLKGFLLRLLVWVVGVCACILVNSFSSAMLLAIISMMMFFFMQVRAKFLWLTIAGAIVAVALMFGVYHIAIGIDPEAKNSKVFGRLTTAESRIGNFFNHDKDSTIDLSKLSVKEREAKDREERQSENAKIAINEGGLFGKGVGNGIARYSLSMAFSDFIFAAIVEETGMVGGVIIILLYLILMFRCVRLSFKCPDGFSQAMVLGLSFLITTQAFLHILVNVRLLPITGHTLPLISHGGTAYLVLSAALGMILSVSRTVSKQEEERRAAEAAEAAAMQGADDETGDTAVTADADTGDTDDGQETVELIIEEK